MKKFIALSLVAILMVCVIPGCSVNQSSSSDSAIAGSTDTSTGGTLSDSEAALPFKETLKITQAEVWRPENDTEVLTYNVLQERLNIEIEYIQIPVASADEQYAMILASGDLPDVVNFPGSIYPDWLKYEAIIPLDDLMNEYAPDFISKLSNEDYIFLKSSDGKIYTVPRHNGDMPNVVGLSSLCVRQDWLDKFSLEMPLTLDDWEDVLTAFKNDDPNGNGVNDEIPFGGSLTPIWDAYGLGQLYVRNNDNTLALKYKDKYYIEAVRKLADWYDKSLIDREYITRNKNNTEMQAITYNGICGSMYMTGTHTTDVTNALRVAGIEDALYVSSKLIEGPRGRNVRGRPSVGLSCAISSKANEPERIMQYLNYPFTEEGIELFNYGVEGETFDVVGGKKILKQELVDGGWNTIRSYGINKVNGTSYYWLSDMFLQMTFKGKTVDTMDEISALAYHAYTDKVLGEAAYKDLPSSLNQVQAYIDYDGASLVTELEDMTNQVIMGLKTVNDLEKLIDDVYENGFKQIEKEANELWTILTK